MTLNEAYIELKTFADNEKLSENARNACLIGADTIREKMADYRNKIKKELENKIRVGVDMAYEKIVEEYSVANYGIDISDDMKRRDYIDGLAEVLANVMVNDIKGDALK